MVRLQLAGLKKENIVCLKDYSELEKYIDIDEDIDLYVLYEVERAPDGREVVERLASYVEEVR